MHHLDALVFDVDGTLADTERDGHRPAFNRAFADAGLDWDWTVELYGELLRVTGGKERIRYYLDKYNQSFVRPAHLDDFIASLHKAKTAHYMTMMAEGAIPLRPGVLRLVEQAREAGVRLAIATTTTPENVTALISSAMPAGAIDWFEVIGAGDIVPSKKPAPDIYTWVCREMGLDPRRAVAFEDSGHGVTSAADAGFEHIVVTTNDYTVDQDFRRASVVADMLGEPDMPCSVKVGRIPESGCIDIDYLHQVTDGGALA